jgi:hypothetical protein
MIKRMYIRSLNIVATAGLLLGLLSCDNGYDPVFDESPDRRISAALNEYDALLTSAPFGWKATLRTGAGLNFFYHFTFNNDGTVSMISDFNETTAGGAGSGTWTLKALQRPTLSFDTYSYIHLPADPDGDVNGGGNGEGLISDFEFAFARTSGDTLYLEGVQKNSRIAFFKATEQDAALLRDGEMKNMLHYINTREGLQFTLPDNRTATVAFSADARIMGVQYLSADGTRVEAFRSSFVFTTTGISLTTPFAVAGNTIQNFVWDREKESYAVQQGSTTTEIREVDELHTFEPSVPLWQSIGTTYPGIQVPAGSNTYSLPGQSDDFLQAYQQAADLLLNGQYRLRLSEINYIFDRDKKTMTVEMYVTQNATRFLCGYRYTYKMSDDGALTFNYNGANENGSRVLLDVYSLLGYFDTDTFRLKYIGGGFDLVGGFFSDENPGFTFSGYVIRKN